MYISVYLTISCYIFSSSTERERVCVRVSLHCFVLLRLCCALLCSAVCYTVLVLVLYSVCFVVFCLLALFGGLFKRFERIFGIIKTTIRFA